MASIGYNTAVNYEPAFHFLCDICIASVLVQVWKMEVCEMIRKLFFQIFFNSPFFPNFVNALKECPYVLDCNTEDS